MDVSLPLFLLLSRTHDRQTYLGGESFAGQYIPYFGMVVGPKSILTFHNMYTADAILTSGLNIPLRGAAIGNGWIDGRSQYPAYLEFAVAHGIIDVESEVHLNLVLSRAGI